MIVLLFFSSVAAADTFVGGTISSNTTWTRAASPYVVTSTVYVQGAASPVLTVEYGVTIKFGQGTALVVGQTAPGALNAQGTSSSSIIFKADSVNPSPGYWNGIQLYSQTVSASTFIISADIKNATNALTITDCSPKVTHVNFIDNSAAGLVVGGSLASPILWGDSFTGNLNGMINNTPTHLVPAYFCWWADPTGPSAGGPGVGESVSTGILYEPWLLSAQTRPGFQTFSIKNRTFNPGIQTSTTLTFTMGSNGTWTTTFYNSLGGTVRTFTGSSSSGTVVWDGKNGSGQTQPDGIYNYKLEYTSQQSEVAAPAKGYAIIDSTKTLTITNLVATPAAFSPNSNGVQDTTTITADLNFDDANWTLNIKNSSNQTVRTASGQGTPASFTWNGKNGSGTAQPEGVYSCVLSATAGTANASATTSVTLDKTKPTGSVTTPTANQTVSNVYQNGSPDVNITGSAADTNLLGWTLEYGAGSSPATWLTLTTGTSTSVSYAWSTDPAAQNPIPNGTYTLRLTVTDLAGNYVEKTRTFILAHFSMTQNVQQFNGSSGGIVTYTSIVPFTLNESIYIYNAAGSLKRTLITNLQRAAGTYQDNWNGRNDQSNLLPEGPYFYQALAKSGSQMMTWNNNRAVYGGTVDNLSNSTLSSPFDPFNNHVPTVNYTMAVPGQVKIIFSSANEVPDTCDSAGDPPTICVVYNQYQASGSHTQTWAGTDETGAYRATKNFVSTDIDSMLVLNDRTAFPQNAVILYGSFPTVTNVAMSPPTLNPLLGVEQKLTFTLTTNGNQPAPTLETSYLNQECLALAGSGQSCVLRTIVKTNVSTGTVQVKWDGKADNGMWVAPGHYTVTIKLTDAIGNVLTTQILTTVQY